jgi:hypothetical protein
MDYSYLLTQASNMEEPVPEIYHSSGLKLN